MMRLFVLFAAYVFSTVQARGAEPATVSSALQDVRIDQRLGDRVPMNAHFRDESGRDVALADCFRGRPVLLSLVYYRCPMLCTVTLNQLGRSLNALSESAGDQFDIITVSFDPSETPELAREKKTNYLRAYRRPTAAAGWHFLTADAASIAQLTDAVGFRYRWDAGQQAFAHASALMVLTPDGRLSRYFLGVDYPPTELRTAIRAAGDGVIGARAEAVYFYCVRYDPATGRYGLIIDRALKLLAAVSVVGVAALIVLLHRMTVRREQQIGIVT